MASSSSLLSEVVESRPVAIRRHPSGVGRLAYYSYQPSEVSAVTSTDSPSFDDVQRNHDRTRASASTRTFSLRFRSFDLSSPAPKHFRAIKKVARSLARDRPLSSLIPPVLPAHFTDDIGASAWCLVYAPGLHRCCHSNQRYSEDTTANGHIYSFGYIHPQVDEVLEG